MEDSQHEHLTLQLDFLPPLYPLFLYAYVYMAYESTCHSVPLNQWV